jgi:hypothetical protein
MGFPQRMLTFLLNSSMSDDLIPVLFYSNESINKDISAQISWDASYLDIKKSINVHTFSLSIPTKL